MLTVLALQCLASRPTEKTQFATVNPAYIHCGRVHLIVKSRKQRRSQEAETLMVSDMLQLQAGGIVCTTYLATGAADDTSWYSTARQLKHTVQYQARCYHKTVGSIQGETDETPRGTDREFFFKVGKDKDLDP